MQKHMDWSIPFTIVLCIVTWVPPILFNWYINKKIYLIKHSVPKFSDFSKNLQNTFENDVEHKQVENKNRKAKFHYQLYPMELAFN